VKYQYRPVRFYLTVLALTWTFWIPGAFMSDDSPGSLGMLFMLLGLFVPSITAIATVFSSGSKALKADFREKLFGAFRVKPFAVAASLITFCAIVAVSILLSTFAGQSLGQFSFTERFLFFRRRRITFAYDYSGIID
jgi:hypothetical protein